MILCNKSQIVLRFIILPFLFAGSFLVSPVFAKKLGSTQHIPSQVDADPYTLIAEVNALRAANGLSPLSPDPILMSITQQHSDYMASIGTVTHYSADGSRPYQRALAAGYPVAGDLSRGGFYSENIIEGRNLSPAEAVSRWTGDAPHLNTMLSPNFTDIGAGVSVVGDQVYYVIDASRKSGTSAPAYTPQSVNGTPVYNLNPLVSTIFPNTPMPDGSITHVVKPGETLWLIAISYGTKIDNILLLNNITKDSPIYPGQKLIIKTELATMTASPYPTNTLSPTTLSTVTVLMETVVVSTPNQSTKGSTNKPSGISKSFLVPIAIIGGALVTSALVALLSGRRRKK